MVFSWNTPRNVYIPTNRKGWAIGMAVAHTLFCNLIGFQAISINEYLATTLQEVNCGCIGGITAPAWVTAPYPIAPTKYYCFDYTHAYAAGYFQEEFPTFSQLRSDIPCFPTFNFDTLVVGVHFETQALVKAYQDFDNVIFWQTKCYNPIGFIRNAKDPYAAEKIISSRYNSGVWSPVVSTILTTNRTAALPATNIGPILDTTSVYNYWEQISRVTAVLDSNLSDVSATDAANHSVTYPGVHKFRDFYDSQISWSDVSNYIDSIAPFYKSVGITATGLKNAVQPVFNSINGGASISFKTQMPPVIDAIVLNLPAFYPTGLGSSCSNSKATMSVSDTVCPGQPLVLKLTLTRTSPWSFIYGKPDGTSQTINNITSSPYSFNVTDTGTYHLISVFDKNGVGSIVCAPIVKAYFKGSMANWNTSNVSGGCATGDLKLNLTGTGDWVVYYNIKGGSTQSVIIPANTTSPYTLITNPAKGDEYTITRVVSGGCDVTMNSSIKVCSACSKPTVSISAIPPLCEGNTLSFNTNVIYNGGATSATYNWVGANNFVSTDKNPSVSNVLPVMTGNYTVTVTDNLLCSQTASVSVIVNTKPVINAGSNQSVCSGKSVILSATGGTNYNWNNSVKQGIPFTPTTSTTYTVTGTDANTCTATSSVAVLVNTSVSITTTTDKSSICKLQTSATLGVTGCINCSSYIWDNSEITSTITVSPTTNTTYSVTVTDGNSCSGTSSINISVNSPITITAVTNIDSICKNQESAILSVMGCSGCKTYTWNNSAGNTSSIVVSPIINTTYTVTITDNNTCTATSSVAVDVNPLPVADASSDVTICPKDTASLSASGGISYKWNTNETIASINVFPLITTKYTVTVYNEFGCTDRDSITVIVSKPPIPLINGNTSICIGSQTTLTASGGQTYLWNDNSGSDIFLIKPAIAGSEKFTVTITDNIGCTNSISITIITNPLPDADAGDSVQLCKSNQTTLSALPDGMMKYEWSNGIYQQSQNVGPSVTTIYNLTVTDSKGCSSKASVKIKVVDKPLVRIDIKDTTVCSQAIVTLTAKGNDQFRWSNDSTNAAITIRPTITSNYTVTMTDINNCSASDQAIVQVVQLPDPPEVVNDVVCSVIAPEGSVKVKYPSSEYKYIWYDALTNGNKLDSGNIFTQKNVTHELYFYLETINKKYGCVSLSRSEAKISMGSAPLVQFTYAPQNFIYEMMDVRFTNLSKANAVTNDPSMIFLWDFGKGEGSSNVKNPIHIYKDAGEYLINLNVTNIDGCTESWSDTIKIIKQMRLWVPEVFTPNGDGRNDILYRYSISKSPINCS